LEQRKAPGASRKRDQPLLVLVLVLEKNADEDEGRAAGTAKNVEQIAGSVWLFLDAFGNIFPGIDMKASGKFFNRATAQPRNRATA